MVVCDLMYTNRVAGTEILAVKFASDKTKSFTVTIKS